MQTISPELAKKLKELGVEQNGYAAWFFNAASNLDKTPYVMPKTDLPDRISDSIEVYSAFTLDEILGMLPVYLKGHSCAVIPEATVDYELKFRKENNYMCKGYSISYDTWRCVECDNISRCNKHIKVPRYEHDKNPAEAAGQLLVWCIENGHVKPGEKQCKQ